MSEFLLWYLLLTLLGWIAFPVAFHFLSNLHDKGYAFARVIALLLWGYIYWIFNTFGLILNSQSGALFALIILAIIGQFFFRRNKKRIVSWLKKECKYVIAVELLFLIAFGFWTIVRAANPQILGTEKPMELAFINAILRSPSFPPNDPWLSGYAISYYYFGYVLVALIAKLLQTSSGIAFNLAVALWFALTAITSYGIVYNLIKCWVQHGSSKKDVKLKSNIQKRILVICILAPIFILIISNAEGFLEMIHSRGLFWSMNENSKLTSTLWNWLDIQELRNPPHEPYSWIPERIGGSWWWRASRVLQDYDLNGNPREIIDEFPFFSFLLADLHPHVLSMPFVTLAISLSLNLFLSTDDWVIKGKSFKNVLTNLPYWVTCLILGSIAFINMWDFPIYLGLFLLTYLVKIVYKEGLNKKIIINFIKTSLVFGAGSVLLYLPFYLGFSSQAAGFLPSMNYFTRGVHFWIMFLPFLVPILVYLIWLDGKTIIKRRIWEGFKASIITIVGLWVISYLWAWFIAIRVQLLEGLSEIVRGGMQDRIVIASNDVNAFLSMHGGTGIRELIRKSFLNRISNPAMIITILILLSLSIAIMLNNICSGRSQLGDCDSINKKETINKNIHVFIGLMILIGTGLTLFPEYFYLRDVFGWRMNTIFKFYFQVWVMWGLAGAFAVVVLWGKLSGVVGVLFRIFICIICVICMTYPIFGLLDKTLKFHPNRWDIDGTSHLSTSNIDEQSAVDYLRNVPYGVIVEAVGGSYSGFARISTLTGLPTVLGWPGHEVQWRGGTEEIGSRESDIDRLFRTPDWVTAREIMEKYEIKYIYIGDLERMKYQVNEVKFQRNLNLVFENNSVHIYCIP